jgi:hypothetical protein
MTWSHSRIMSVHDADGALVVHGDKGWEAFPFGLDGGASGAYPTREQAIETVESLLGEVTCCVGHLADDSDR